MSLIPFVIINSLYYTIHLIPIRSSVPPPTPPPPYNLHSPTSGCALLTTRRQGRRRSLPQKVSWPGRVCVSLPQNCVSLPVPSSFLLTLVLLPCVPPAAKVSARTQLFIYPCYIFSVRTCVCVCVYLILLIAAFFFFRVCVCVLEGKMHSLFQPHLDTDR